MRSKYLLKIIIPGIIAALLIEIFFTKPIYNQSTNSQTIARVSTPVTEKEIVIGEIDRRYQPLADYLAANLREFGISKGKVRIFPNMEKAIAALEGGEIEVFFADPYSTAIASENTGAKPIVRRWRKGKLKEYALLIARKDRDINTLSDLRGKTLALRDSHSATGYLLPVSMLLEAGFLPVTNFSANTEARQKEIRYIFGRSSKNIIEWVISSQVDAGTVTYSAYKKLEPEIRNSMVILAETEKFPQQFALLRADLDRGMAEEIETILLNMNRNAEGRAVLEKFRRTSKFDRPSQEDLTRIIELYDRIPYRR